MKIYAFCLSLPATCNCTNSSQCAVKQFRFTSLPFAISDETESIFTFSSGRRILFYMPADAGAHTTRTYASDAFLSQQIVIECVCERERKETHTEKNTRVAFAQISELATSKRPYRCSCYWSLPLPPSFIQFRNPEAIGLANNKNIRITLAHTHTQNE